MTKTQLEALLKGSYDPHELVSIKKNFVAIQKANEDHLLIPSKIPRAKKRNVRIPVMLPPSQHFAQAVKDFDSGEGAGTPEAVLGTYFKLFKELYGEEDPEWGGTKYEEPLEIITTFGVNVIGRNYRQAITFLKLIMPLWYRRLKLNSGWPSKRPNVKVLFGGKRHFWNNRKLYYREWKAIQ